MTTAPAEQEPTPAELHIEITGLVDRVTKFTLLIRDLHVTPRQGLGFLSPDTRAALDRQTREERRTRDWNAQQSLPAPAGDNPTPGNLAAFSAVAELTMTLRHTYRRLFKHFATRGVPLTTQLPDAADVDVIAAHVRDLATLVTDTRILGEVTRDLQHAVDTADLVVNGDPKARLDDPCPYCGETTLVVYFRDDLIRCDRNPRTGQYTPCRCPDPICQCKTKPIAYRHTWYRHPYDERRRTPADTWHRLKGLIAFARRRNRPTTTEEPPS